MLCRHCVLSQTSQTSPTARPSLAFMPTNFPDCFSEAKRQYPTIDFIKVSGQIEAILSVSCAVMLSLWTGRFETLLNQSASQTLRSIYSRNTVCGAVLEKLTVTHVKAVLYICYRGGGAQM